MGNVIVNVTAEEQLPDNGQEIEVKVQVGESTYSRAEIVSDDNEQGDISNVNVNWSVTGPGSCDPASSATDKAGYAVTKVKAAKSGTVKVKATTADDTEGKSLELKTVHLLPPPVVLNATKNDNFLIDQYDINFGVYVRVDAYPKPNPSSGQTLTFHWGKYSLAMPVYSFKDFPIFFNLKEEMAPAALRNGEYIVYYDVQDAGKNITNSEKFTVNVNGDVNTGGVGLPSPDIPAVASNPYINIAAVENGNGIEVVANYDFDDDDIGSSFNVYWKASNFHEQTLLQATTVATKIITADDVKKKSASVKIAKSYFYPDNGKGFEGEVECYYTLYDKTTDTVSLSMTTVCGVDTVAP